MLERDIERRCILKLFSIIAEYLVLYLLFGHRQESYISRERAYKMRIDELEEELNNQRQAKTGWMKTDPKVYS